MEKKISAFCIAGANSGAGKTTITLAIISALSRRGYRVAPFKCGPDYIDSSYLSAASSTTSNNLDTWIMGPDGVNESFSRNSANCDVAVVEGVMGLFDGASPHSISGSTADCALTLDLPIILVVNASGMAGTIAPLVYGFSKFHPKVKIIGVIANKVGTENHAKLLAESLRASKQAPLLGAFPKDENISVPERHLGLLPWNENKKEKNFFHQLAKKAENFINIEKILQISQRKKIKTEKFSYPKAIAKIALAKDEAFSFYYPDNFHKLKMAGFELIEFSPLRDRKIPSKVDMIYIGGGFPEIFADKLSDNSSIRKQIKDAANSGLPIYAECGGLMFLSKELRNSQGKTFPMCNVIPGKTVMTNRIKSLGYRELTSIHDLPFCENRTVFRGHEFHWSEFIPTNKIAPIFKCKDSKGKTWLDGIRIANTFASYMHLHFANSKIFFQHIS